MSADEDLIIQETRLSSCNCFHLFESLEFCLVLKGEEMTHDGKLSAVIKALDKANEFESNYFETKPKDLSI